MDNYVLNSGTVALTASTTKTVAQIATPSTQRIVVNYLSIAFDGAASAVPAKVDLLRQTTAGTGSVGTAYPLDPNSPSSLTTCMTGATVEPTASTVLFSWYVVPNGGLFMVNFAPGEEVRVDENDRIGVRVNSPSSCNTIVNIGFLE